MREGGGTLTICRPARNSRHHTFLNQAQDLSNRDRIEDGFTKFGNLGTGSNSPGNLGEIWGQAAILRNLGNLGTGRNFGTGTNGFLNSAFWTIALTFLAMATIDIEHLAGLAQLQLTPDEHAAVTKDLGRIIDMVDQMQSMPTEDVVPLAHPLDAKLRLRKDEVTEVVDRDRLQRGAPATRDGLYLVPRVVE